MDTRTDAQPETNMPLQLLQQFSQQISEPNNSITYHWEGVDENQTVNTTS